MSELTDAANLFRRELLNQESRAIDDLLLSYKDAYTRIQYTQKQLFQEIRAEENSKGKVSKAWLQRNERYKELLTQIETEVSALSQNASQGIRYQVQSAVIQGERDAQQLASTALAGETRDATVIATWNRLPVETLNELSANLSHGSPVLRLLDSLGPTTVREAKSVLFAGIAGGFNPRKTARQLQKTAGYAAVRARTISRTETLRAYRQATVESYRANEDVVTGWKWLATLSVRTCPACLALHGKEFPLEEDFGSHPNCRCTTVPVTEDSKPIPSGEEWLKQQDVTTQQKILGKAKYNAYAGGKITLQDLIHEEDSPIWGKTRSEASLKEALAKAVGTAKERR